MRIKVKIVSTYNAIDIKKQLSLNLVKSVWTFNFLKHHTKNHAFTSVSEHMGWVRNVVLMNVYSGSGKPRGVGISGKGRGQMGKMGKCKG